jgi:hypothetical protein
MSKIVNKTITYSNCGAVISEDDEFCKKCGARFTQEKSSKAINSKNPKLEVTSLEKKLGIATIINGSISLACLLVSIIILAVTGATGTMGIVSVSFGFTAIGFGIAAIITGILAIRHNAKNKEW